LSYFIKIYKKKRQQFANNNLYALIREAKCPDPDTAEVPIVGWGRAGGGQGGVLRVDLYCKARVMEKEFTRCVISCMTLTGQSDFDQSKSLLGWVTIL
jgi:hypothetical protein